MAILGAGPSGLFMFKKLLDAGQPGQKIDIFEKGNQLGAGMPYSSEGANDEHITNVSGNEIPSLSIPLHVWIKTVHKDTLRKFNIDPANFNEYKVLPRLLFGQYLSDQFRLLLQAAKDADIECNVHYNCKVADITDHPDKEIVEVETEEGECYQYDHVIVCTGHRWPEKHEGLVPGYFDSPYPPARLRIITDHPVAIKGSSLTAVDAVRTLARHNGIFFKDAGSRLVFKTADHSPQFRIVLHSRSGMLPAVRFHLEDSPLGQNSLLSKEEIAVHIKENEGFLSLDFIFEKNFKEALRKKDPEFYAGIIDMNMEDFVTAMMDKREQADPFRLLKAEYAEAEKSIERKESVYWKEMLGGLSFTLNYPAKHLSAEDMQRLKKVLQPLISVIIAYIPQSSCEELLAMYEAGILNLVPVGDDSEVEPQDNGGVIYRYTDEEGTGQSVYFNTFIDAVGQPHLTYGDFPFKSLVEQMTVSPARLKFRSSEKGEHMLKESKSEVEQDQDGKYYLRVPGVTINDNFQVVDRYGALNERIYMMAVPYMGGYNPDYSGLDFCEAASSVIVNSIYLKDGQPAIAVN